MKYKLATSKDFPDDDYVTSMIKFSLKNESTLLEALVIMGLYIESLDKSDHWQEAAKKIMIRFYNDNLTNETP